jgi:hypothetical protein
MPGEAERAQIWEVQLHPLRTPLAADVDFKALALRYEVSGGDIQNAVLKAALAAAAEPIPDSSKRIHQHHFEAGIEEVIANKRVMQQSQQVTVSGAKYSIAHLMSKVILSACPVRRRGPCQRCSVMVCLNIAAVAPFETPGLPRDAEPFERTRSKRCGL